MQSVSDQLAGIFQDLLRGLIDSIPEILAAIVLIVVAFVAAGVVERLLRVALVRLKFDSLVRRTGVDSWLHKMGIRRSIDDFIPRLFYFLLLFLFARTAADRLGLDAISGAIGSVLDYMPNLIAALLILVFGSAAAQFIGRGVAATASEAGVEYARTLGNMVSGVIFFVLGVMALSQLRVETEVIRLFATALLGGVALAFAIAFGFGTREAIRNIVAGFYMRRAFRVGDELEVGGYRGTLAAVHPTQSFLQTEDGQVSLANTSFSEDVRRRPRTAG